MIGQIEFPSEEDILNPKEYQAKFASLELKPFELVYRSKKIDRIADLEESSNGQFKLINGFRKNPATYEYTIAASKGDDGFIRWNVISFQKLNAAQKNRNILVLGNDINTYPKSNTSKNHQQYQTSKIVIKLNYRIYCVEIPFFKKPVHDELSEKFFQQGLLSYIAKENVEFYQYIAYYQEHKDKLVFTDILARRYSFSTINTTQIDE